MVGGGGDADASIETLRREDGDGDATPFDDVRDRDRERPDLETAIETRRAIAAAYDGARPATRATALWELCEMRFAAGRDLRDVVDAAAEANPESFPFRGPKALGADADGARYVLADDVVRGGGMRLYREGDAAWDDGWDDGWDDDAKTDEAKTDDAKTDDAKTDEATDSDARPPRPRISLPRHPFYVEDESSVVFLDDVPCMCCGRVDDEATFVLCDACPNGGHLACLGLERVPTGYWSCAVCASRRRAPVRPSPGPGSWEVVATDPEELAAVGARLTASGDATTLGAALSRDVADDVAAKFEREATRRAKKEAKAMRRANEEAKAAASAAARKEKRRRRAKRSAWWMCRRTEPGRKTRGAALGISGISKVSQVSALAPAEPVRGRGGFAVRGVRVEGRRGRVRVVRVVSQRRTLSVPGDAAIADGRVDVRGVRGERRGGVNGGTRRRSARGDAAEGKGKRNVASRGEPVYVDASSPERRIVARGDDVSERIRRASAGRRISA